MTDHRSYFSVLLDLLAVACVLLLSDAVTAQTPLRVGVWNIERLSATADRGFPELQSAADKLPPRTDSDLQKMAEYEVSSGTTEYDPTTLGFKDAGPFEVDCNQTGNGNMGHLYGTTLPEEQKQQLIEFLKTL